MYLAIMKAIPMESDLFSGSTNLIIQAIQGIPDMRETQMMTKRMETKMKK